MTRPPRGRASDPPLCFSSVMSATRRSLMAIQYAPYPPSNDAIRDFLSPSIDRGVLFGHLSRAPAASSKTARMPSRRSPCSSTEPRFSMRIAARASSANSCERATLLSTALSLGASGGSSDDRSMSHARSSARSRRVASSGSECASALVLDMVGGVVKRRVTRCRSHLVD